MKFPYCPEQALLLISCRIVELCYYVYILRKSTIIIAIVDHLLPDCPVSIFSVLLSSSSHIARFYTVTYNMQLDFFNVHWQIYVMAYPTSLYVCSLFGLVWFGMV